MELIPQAVSSKNHFKAPWINTHIKRISNTKKRAYNRARSTGLPSDRSKYHNLKQLSQRECHKAHNPYVRHLVSPDNDSNHKCLWSYIKSRRQENIGMSTLKDDKGTYKESIDKANVLNKYFSTVLTKENTNSLPAFDGSSYPLIDAPQVGLYHCYRVSMSTKLVVQMVFFHRNCFKCSTIAHSFIPSFS